MKKKDLKNILTVSVLLLLCVSAGCGRRSAKSLERELSYREQGITKLNEGEYEEAVRIFQKALDQSLAVVEDLEIDICYYKAMAQYKAGDIKGALETYSALIKYDEKNAKALYLRGTLCLQEGNFENAWEDYKKALEADTNNAALYNKIAEKLQNIEKLAEAEKVLNDALLVEGDKPSDYREKGYSYYLLGQYDNARTFFDRAINGGDTEAIYYLAKIFEAEGDAEEANRLYETYIGKNSSDTVTLNDLGCGKMNEGEYEQALIFFQTALANENPANEQELRRNEIIALENMFRFTQARQKMEVYLKYYPEDEAAVREYEFLKSR